MRALDRWAARHKVIATIAVAAIVVGCLMWAHEIDEADTAALRLQLINRTQT